MHSVSSREKSPARQKAEYLTEQLQSIGDEDDAGRHKREYLVQRARNIYDKLEKTDLTDDTRSKMFREQIAQVEGEMNEEKDIRESFEQEKKEAMGLLEKEFSQLTAEYKKEVVSRENHLEIKIDERFSKVRGEITHEYKKRAEGQNEMVRNVSDHIAELNGMIAAQRKNREDTYEILIKQLGNDILRLNEAINATRKAREDSHSKVYRLMEELQTKFSREITAEKTVRTRNEDTLIRYLDETVDKANGL